MNAGVRWALVATLMLVAVALLRPNQTSTTSQLVVAADRPTALPGNSGPNTLPEQLPLVALDEARLDPFVGFAPPPIAQPQPIRLKPKPVQSVEQVAPLPPSPPPVSYRYLGKLVDPQGQVLVYLTRQDEIIQVSNGTKLPDGYVIESISANSIRLHFPSLDARAMIVIPPAKESVDP